jgi:hypothetical protein
MMPAVPDAAISAKHLSQVLRLGYINQKAKGIVSISRVGAVPFWNFFLGDFSQ